MLKESSNKLEGNDRYEGFGIELIDELSKMNEFNYTFDIQVDGVYGSLDKKTGKWSGMMQKVMEGVIIFYYIDLNLVFFQVEIAPCILQRIYNYVNFRINVYLIKYSWIKMRTTKYSYIIHN